MSINSIGQFGNSYPTRAQQYQRAYSANWKTTNPAKMPYKPTTKTPTGSAYGKRWGELTRKSVPGRDIWGGRENPSLPFKGKTAQRTDYWHQMAEQPRTPSIRKPRVATGGNIGGGMTGIGSIPGGVGGAGTGKQFT